MKKNTIPEFTCHIHNVSCFDYCRFCKEALDLTLGNKHDPVNRPSHYAFSSIEVIDALEAWGLDFHRGNAVKYIVRAGRKDPAKKIEDLKKAQYYLNRYIQLIENQNKVAK